MPPKLERSVTAGKVDKGVQGAAAIVKGVWDILSVFPYLFKKCLAIIISTLQWACANIAQAVGVLVLTILVMVYIDAVYNVRGAVACFIYPSLCAGQDMRVR